MFRAATRSAPRALRPSTTVAGRRFASTAPADKRYSWKGTAARWSLAIGALYWYNTSPMFADELPHRLSPEPPQFSESDLPTVDAIVEEKRRQLDARLKAKQEQAGSKDATAAASATPIDSKSPSPAAENKTEAVGAAAPGETEKTPEELEEEAGQQGAFNPETGEINWDCPCLGGMAHGPCGEEFKAAFSCFVYSNEEPKGMDCIDKFQHMQDCFRKYPDVYGAEIADEEAAEAEAEAEAAAAGLPATSSDNSDATNKDATPNPAEKPAEKKPTEAVAPKEAHETHEYSSEQHKTGPTETPKAGSTPTGDATPVTAGETKEGDLVEERGVPKRSFDATSANVESSK